MAYILLTYVWYTNSKFCKLSTLLILLYLTNFNCHISGECPNKLSFMGTIT